MLGWEVMVEETDEESTGRWLSRRRLHPQEREAKQKLKGYNYLLTRLCFSRICSFLRIVTNKGGIKGYIGN